MTVYIDAPTWPGHGRLWSHMISDTSYEELHGFAAALGIPRQAFERDHYDVVAERYAAARAAGAQPATSREIVLLLHAAGLRRRKPWTRRRWTGEEVASPGRMDASVADPEERGT